MGKRASAVLLVLALLASACGSGGGDGASDGDAAGTAGGENAAAQGPGVERIPGEGEPQRGGTLVHLLPADVQSLDPHTSASSTTQSLVGMCYSRLLAFKTGPDVEYGEQVLEGDLAESWEESPDGLTYTFTLRDDVRWHDIAPVNGRPLRAQDVVASMNRIKAEGVQRYMLEAVERVEAPDDRTVVFHMSRPYAAFLSYMANHTMWILPEEATNGGYDPGTTVIGTGPFILDEREVNVRTTYRANPDYYGEGPYLDGYERVIVPDQGARIAAFRAGQADIIQDMSPQENESVLRTTPGSQLLSLLAGSHVVAYLNQSEAPFDDLRVRHAVSMAIDREGLMQAITNGGAYSGPVVGSLGQWALDQDELAASYPHDPERARELLAEAGYADGFDITLTTTGGYGDQVPRAAEWVKQDLAAIGVEAHIEIVDFAQYIGTRLPQGQFQMVVGVQTQFTEPDEWLRAQHHSESSRNWFGIADPELDVMLEEQLTMLDPEERVEAVHEIQRYIIDEVMNPVPLWVYLSLIMVSDRVQNWHPQPGYARYEYRHIWLDQSA